MSDMLSSIGINIYNNFYPEGFQYNLALIYLFTFSSQSARAVWDGIISNYVYFLSDNSNFSVGSFTGLVGLAQLIMSPFIGYLADKMSKFVLLKYAGYLGFITIITTIFAVIREDLFIFSISMILWGCFSTSSSPTLDALLADTVGNGCRSKVYTARLSIMNLSNAFGPLLTVFMFFYLGDFWTLYDCKVVMVVGLLFNIIPIFLLFMFQSKRDQTKKLVQKEANETSTSLYQKAVKLFKSNQNNDITTYIELSLQSSHGESTLRDTSEDTQIEMDVKLDIAKEGEESEKNDIIDDCTDVESTITLDSDDISKESTQVVKTTKQIEQATEIDIPPSMRFYVPLAIAIGDVITGLASGMTIKFFPIYFMETLKMGPIAVNLVSVVTPIFITISAFMTQRLSIKIGRVWACVWTKTIGVLLLLLLAYQTYNKQSLL